MSRGKHPWSYCRECTSNIFCIVLLQYSGLIIIVMMMMMVPVCGKQSVHTTVTRCQHCRLVPQSSSCSITGQQQQPVDIYTQHVVVRLRTRGSVSCRLYTQICFSRLVFANLELKASTVLEKIVICLMDSVKLVSQSKVVTSWQNTLNSKYSLYHSEIKQFSCKHH